MIEFATGTDVRLLFALVLLAWSLVRGANPDRILAIVLAGVAGLDCVQGRFAQGNEGFQIIAIDLVAFGIASGVAMRANRLYPLVIGALQLTKLVSHFWRLCLDRVNPSAHLLIEHTCLTSQLCCLALGLALHVNRRRKVDQLYPDWIR